MRQLDLSRAHDPVAVEAKLRRLDRDREIHIHHLGMASRRITADYPELAGWFCLRVMTGREEAVEKTLSDSDVEALMPMRKAQRIYRRHRLVDVPATPLFRGYLLVRFVPKASAFNGIRSIKGALGFVGSFENPHKIPDRIVKKFKKLASNGVYAPQPVLIAYQRGQQVKITLGPFAGLGGKMITSTKVGDTDGCVDVSAGGAVFPVNLPLAFLQKL